MQRTLAWVGGVLVASGLLFGCGDASTSNGGGGQAGADAGGGTGGSAGSATGGSAGSATGGSAGTAGAGGDPATACTQAGGTVSTAQCCRLTANFPNTCSVGPCGCSPTNSHEVAVCQCPSGQCWDGSDCVAGGTGGSGGGGTGGAAGNGGTGGTAGSGGTGGAAGSSGAGGSGGTGGGAQGCTSSGGTIASTSCCKTVGDFPNTCSVGACGCAPKDSHKVQTCTCPSNTCFDGTSCK